MPGPFALSTAAARAVATLAATPPTDPPMMHARPLSLFIALAAGGTLLSVPADAGAQRRDASAKATQQLICTDFYSHANADWLAAHPPLAASGVQSALGELASRARQQQMEMLDDD